MAAALPPSVLWGAPRLPPHVPATWGWGEDKPTEGGGGESEEEESRSASVRLPGDDAVCDGARRTPSGSAGTELSEHDVTSPPETLRTGPRGLSEHGVTSPPETLRTGPRGVLLQGQDSLQV